MTPTYPEILDLIDPDWSARWRGDSDRAAKFYQKYNLAGWQGAIYEIRGEDDTSELYDTELEDERINPQTGWVEP